MNSINELINELDKLMEIQDLQTKVICDDDDDPYFYGETFITDERAGDVEGNAAALFVRMGGKVNYNAVDEFNRVAAKKYRVGPGETDSFGWLSGIISTPKGIIVWG